VNFLIELLENQATHAESGAYIRFLEDNGVECVASHMRWIYLLLLGVLFFVLGRPLKKRIKNLEKEKEIRE